MHGFLPSVRVEPGCLGATHWGQPRAPAPGAARSPTGIPKLGQIRWVRGAPLPCKNLQVKSHIDLPFLSIFLPIWNCPYPQAWILHGIEYELVVSGGGKWEWIASHQEFLSSVWQIFISINCIFSGEYYDLPEFLAFFLVKYWLSEIHI